MALKLKERSLPFNLETTLRCGQLFRWEKHGSWWYGVVDQQLLKVNQMKDIIKYEGAETEFIRKYFRLEDDLPQITSEISRDSVIKKAVEAFPGLRIVRQNPWECLISYVCATYKNIPAIKGMISELAKRFGNKIAREKLTYHTFPEPSVLANATLHELRTCKLGFRAERVRETARTVHHNRVDLEALRKVDYERAKNELLKLPGVGNKVADCVLLFSLEKLEAFPVDVWMKRVVESHYTNHFDASFIEKISGKTSLSPREYNKVSSFARGYFGRYAGYAQEYLYHFFRNKLVHRPKGSA